MLPTLINILQTYQVLGWQAKLLDLQARRGKDFDPLIGQDAGGIYALCPQFGGICRKRELHHPYTMATWNMVRFVVYLKIPFFYLPLNSEMHLSECES